MTIEVIAADPAGTLARARAAMIRACRGEPLGVVLTEGSPTTLSVPRDWMWWSAVLTGPDRFVLTVALEGFPVSGYDALRGLLMACGASEVRGH